jgi:hypothetical protein
MLSDEAIFESRTIVEGLQDLRIRQMLKHLAKEAESSCGKLIVDKIQAMKGHCGAFEMCSIVVDEFGNYVDTAIYNLIPN